jgi:hypothetical protein
MMVGYKSYMRIYYRSIDLRLKFTGFDYSTIADLIGTFINTESTKTVMTVVWFPRKDRIRGGRLE